MGFWSPSLFSVSPEMYLSEVLYLGCSCFVIGATCSLKFATLTESMRMCLLRYLVIKKSIMNLDSLELCMCNSSEGYV